VVRGRAGKRVEESESKIVSFNSLEILPYTLLKLFVIVFKIKLDLLIYDVAVITVNSGARLLE
jgi:hypothetical protein